MPAKKTNQQVVTVQNIRFVQRSAIRNFRGDDPGYLNASSERAGAIRKDSDSNSVRPLRLNENKK